MQSAVSSLPSKSKSKSLGVRGSTLANFCAHSASAVLAFASGCTENKGLLTSQALPLSEAILQAASFCGFVCKLLLFLGHCFAVKTGYYS